MTDLATLSLFLLAVLALFLSPGPNMAFVLSHGLALRLLLLDRPSKGV